MLRVLHTADWHLGQLLHELPRDREHDAFLAWLLEAVDEHGVDALVVAGDVFDGANPPASAQARWYGFLGALARRHPGLDVVVIGGNHDSAARLDAPRPVLDALGVRVVGGLVGRRSALDLDGLVVPLHDRAGAVAAWLAAVPYLRVADLPPADDADDPLVEGVREIYRLVLDRARARRQPGQALLAAGHCYMVGAATSALSERKILGGNLHALPVSLFPDDVTAVFLGHLHLAQAVGSDRVRYSGSPIPLAVDEAHYPHQVRLVDLDGDALVASRALRVPRLVDMLRIPDTGPGLPDAVLAALAQLPPRDDQPLDTLPFLEVRVALDAPEPGLRRRVEEVLDDRAARLVKLSVTTTGSGQALADAQPTETLAQLGPEQVFVRRYRQVHEGDPPPALLASFHELLDAVLRDEDEVRP